MAEKKVTTIMVLKVDLQCPSCYKKVKKLLCKFPQIRNQIFDEKQNTVTITVVCCSPEKIRDKLCCKGGKTIKGIQILEPPKPPPKVDPPPPKVSKVDPPPPPPPPKVDPPPPAKVDPPPPPPKVDTPPPPPPPTKVDPPPPAKVDPPPPKVNPPKVDPPAPAPPPPKRVDPPPLLPPAPPPAPIGVCCGPCYEGRAGGPCYHGCGRPVPCYDGYYGSGGGRVCYVSRCDDYFSDENATGCTIM